MSEELIPVFINSLDRNVFWTWKETNIFLFFATLGFFSLPFPIWLNLVIALMIGALGVMGYRRLKVNKIGDLTTNGLYWFSFNSQKIFKTMPQSFVRNWLI